MLLNVALSCQHLRSWFVLGQRVHCVYHSLGLGISTLNKARQGDLTNSRELLNLSWHLWGRMEGRILGAPSSVPIPLLVFSELNIPQFRSKCVFLRIPFRHMCGWRVWRIKTVPFMKAPCLVIWALKENCIGAQGPGFRPAETLHGLFTSSTMASLWMLCAPPGSAY